MMINDLDRLALEASREEFLAIEEIQRVNRQRVQDAFIKNRVSAALFAGSTGYGFGDVGRDTLDRLFSDIVGSEDGLCRSTFLSGTHAITVALFGVLRPGMKLLYAVGEPYDTLKTVITKKGVGSLADFGVGFDFVPTADGRPDLREIARRSAEADVVMIQRSRGYSLRDTLRLSDIKEICDAVRASNPRAIILCDNCYGEFVETAEPCTAGADLIMGSMLKNPGGAIAQTGGYIAGKKELVELCENRLTAPGTGRELGCAPHGHREEYLGLYFAPSAVEQAMKTAAYASHLFELMGYTVYPKAGSPKGDIVTAISLGSEKKVVDFCGCIQSMSPVDSFAAPEGYPMPGYDCNVIMASGAFTEGSSIELSCDAPLREPFTVFLQGGVHFDYARRALLKAAQSIGNCK